MKPDSVDFKTYGSVKYEPGFRTAKAIFNLGDNAMDEKNKHQFQVGDRVAMYDYNGRREVTIDTLTPDEDGCITIRHSGGDIDSVHPKQLRKLKNKVPLDKEVIEDFWLEFITKDSLSWDDEGSNAYFTPKEAAKLARFNDKRVRLTVETLR